MPKAMGIDPLSDVVDGRWFLYVIPGPGGREPWRYAVGNSPKAATYGCIALWEGTWKEEIPQGIFDSGAMYVAASTGQPFPMPAMPPACFKRLCDIPGLLEL